MTLYDRFYSTFIYEERYRYFLDGLKMTLLLTVASFILGCLVGIGFCALKKSRHTALRKMPTWTRSARAWAWCISSSTCFPI